MTTRQSFAEHGRRNPVNLSQRAAKGNNPPTGLTQDVMALLSVMYPSPRTSTTAAVQLAQHLRIFTIGLPSMRGSEEGTIADDCTVRNSIEKGPVHVQQASGLTSGKCYLRHTKTHNPSSKRGNLLPVVHKGITIVECWGHYWPGQGMWIPCKPAISCPTTSHSPELFRQSKSHWGCDGVFSTFVEGNSTNINNHHSFYHR